MNNPIISVYGVTKSYKDIRAVSDVSLSVRRGEIFGLIGPDGAGKSTLFHMLTGVLRRDKGDITILGIDVVSCPEQIKSEIGFLPQGLGLALAQELSVEENINFFAEINHIPFKDREEKKKILLKKTQLAPFCDRPAKNLSGGMKQKLALCCTLIHSPKIIFLDEPTTGVDPISRRELWSIINTIVKETGLTVFLTTSSMDEAQRCTHVALMHQGIIIEQGEPSALCDTLQNRIIHVTVDNQHQALEILNRTPGVQLAYSMGDSIHVFTEQLSLETLRTVLVQETLTLTHIAPGTGTLEDIFLSHMTKERQKINVQALQEFFKEDIQIRSKKKEPGHLTSMIEATSLEKRFGHFIAVNNLSFSVQPGEIFGFLGPNGAGKTTTIKMLCGLFPPTAGKGTIAGLDLFTQQFAIKQHIGYMSQKFSLYRDLTVAENIELYGALYGVPRKELRIRRDLILHIADLEGREHMLTADLPMGIKQRLALGCAIIHKPPCIFLDEPTSGVDPVARRMFWDIIFLLSRTMHITVLVTTHYMDEAEHCDRLLLIHHGNRVALGSAQELKHQVAQEIGILLTITTTDPFLAMDTLATSFPYCFIYGSNVHVYTKDMARERPLIEQILKDNHIEIKDIREQTMPFEDVFVYFCEKKEAQP